MDKLDTYKLLMRVMERRSFTAAANDLGVSRSTATEAVARLEAHLGVQLVQRCVEVLACVEDAEAAFTPTQPRGLLRISVHPTLARIVLLPRLSEFLGQHPQIDLQLGEADWLVDLIEEGTECAIRAGEPNESGMIVRRIGTLHEVTCASPAYLARHGRPHSVSELEGHQMIGFVSSRSGQVMPLEFTVDGEVKRVTLPSRVTVTGADSMAAFGVLGYGVTQQPRYRLRDDLAGGRLVEILSDYPPPPTPLSILYPQGRPLAPRVRAFIDWVTKTIAVADL